MWGGGRRGYISWLVNLCKWSVSNFIMDTFLSQSETRSESVSQSFNWSGSQEVRNIFTLIFLNMIDSNDMLDNIYHGLRRDYFRIGRLQKSLMSSNEIFIWRNFNSLNSQVSSRSKNKVLRILNDLISATGASSHSPISLSPSVLWPRRTEDWCIFCSSTHNREHEISQSRHFLKDQTTTRN